MSNHHLSGTIACSALYGRRKYRQLKNIQSSHKTIESQRNLLGNKFTDYTKSSMSRSLKDAVLYRLHLSHSTLLFLLLLLESLLIITQSITKNIIGLLWRWIPKVNTLSEAIRPYYRGGSRYTSNNCVGEQKK